MRTRKLEEKDHVSVESIARELGHRSGGGGWFSPDAYGRMIPFDIRVQRGFVAEEAGRVIGFITYTSYDNSPHISWIGVSPEMHRKGVGKALLESVEAELKDIGWTELLVETPTEETGLGTDYENTYKFYSGAGFRVLRIRRQGEPHFECDCDIAVLRKVLE